MSYLAAMKFKRKCIMKCEEISETILIVYSELSRGYNSTLVLNPNESTKIVMFTWKVQSQFYFLLAL